MSKGKFPAAVLFMLSMIGLHSAYAEQEFKDLYVSASSSAAEEVTQQSMSLQENSALAAEEEGEKDLSAEKSGKDSLSDAFSFVRKTADEEKDRGALAHNLTTPAGILQWLFSTIAVLGIIFIIAYMLRRTRFVQRSVGSMQVEGQLALGPKERIVRVRVGDRHLLLGVTAGNISLLTELNDSSFSAEISMQSVNKDRRKTERSRVASAGCIMPDDEVLQRRVAKNEAAKKQLQADKNAESFEKILAESTEQAKNKQ